MFQKKIKSLQLGKKATIWLLLLFFTKSAAASLPQQISVSISADRPQYSEKDGLTITVTYQNRSVETIRILKWGTALEKNISHDLFSVIYEGESLPYIGRHYKRAAATDDDFLVIGPLQSVSRTIDLESLYPMNYSGKYTVEYRDHNHRHQGLLAESNEKHPTINLNLKADRAIRFQKIAPNFQDCNSGDLAAIDRALSDAETISRVARNALRNTPVNSRVNAERYRRWFGTYALDRWNRVQSNFDLIYDAAANRQINFICDYNESAYAYVYPGQPYNIYLGQAFFAAPANGTDSKSGVIVHELSHFLVLGGTNRLNVHPEVYGTSSNLALARNNPEHASWNAESHEYFAENTPFFSMPAPEVDRPEQPESTDMRFRSINVDNESPRSNSEIAVSGILTNISGVTLSSIKLTSYLSEFSTISTSDSKIGSISIGSIGVGASQDFNMEVEIPGQEGVRYVGICATASSAEGTKRACSSAVEIDILDSIII
ncbi:MAG: M35 family metallo-endopeptidase, partial [Gammaproteobacteria bacterium]|nr:M35 family metallo-endopeptidase [Gammaproteobacteria bacterium]